MSGIDYSKWDDIDAEESEEEPSEDEDVNEYPETELPNGWIRVGFVNIHPSERSSYGEMYSPTILTEDPLTFLPDPAEFNDGIITDWGLKKAPFEQGDPISSIMRSYSSSFQACRTYRNKPDPKEQFISKLAERKEAFIGSEQVQELMNSCFFLRISLCCCEDDVWRTVRVPAAIDVAKFHDQVLGPVMGWGRAYHGYVFEDPKDGAVLGPKKYDGYIDMMHAPMQYSHIMEDQRYPLAGILQKKGDFLHYTYDLGDHWQHKIEVVDVATVENYSNILLLDGAGACPPEDSNGLEGKGCYTYSEFLREYKAKPKSLRMKEALREAESHAVNYSRPWIGGPPRKFRPLKFDIGYHRLLLAAIVAGPAVKKKGKPGFNEFKESFKACTGCGDRMKALLNCSKCGAWYCSRDCQVADWKNHKPKCKERRAKQAAKAAAR